MHKIDNSGMTIHPDILKNVLHTVQLVLINSKKDSKGSSLGKVVASSLTSRVSFNATISITDLINDSFGALGGLGTLAFNNADLIDSKLFGGAVGRALGSGNSLPPLVPKLSYERVTAYGGASAVSSSIELIFVYKDNFKEQVIDNVNTLADWYLPKRGGNIGDFLGKSVDFLKKKDGDTKILEGLKAIGRSIQDVTADIFKSCFFLEVPDGGRNPTRVYFGPSDTGFVPVYCGEWLVNSFDISTSDFVVYDPDANCLRPEVVKITLGLFSWRVTDSSTFKIFDK